jgi:hypothetical protein
MMSAVMPVALRDSAILQGCTGLVFAYTLRFPWV